MKMNVAHGLVLGIACAAFASAALAQDLTVGGFLEFESHYGIDYDSSFVGAQDQVTQLDFAVDGRLNFDYSNATKSGLEYGMHFELDMYQSDDDALISQVGAPLPVFPLFFSDIATGDVVEFNDGYVFINTSLGNLAFGDAGVAGKASNQLNVPILPFGAFEVDSFQLTNESEVVRYSNSFAGVDFEASVDDDGVWALGVGYEASLGAADVALGLSALRTELPYLDMPLNSLAGSLQASIGGLTAGVNYASAQIPHY